MTKPLFPLDLNESNIQKRNYLLTKLRKYVDLRHSDLLEIGIGNGRFGVLLADQVAHYYGIDPDEEYVRIARTNIPAGAQVTYKVGRAEEIPFQQQFDVVLYAHSWHCIKDFGRALLEAARILKPQGIVIILEPLATNKKWCDPRLQPESPEFDAQAFERKRQSIIAGREAILRQTLFRIMEDEYDSRVGRDFYVLRRGE